MPLAFDCLSNKAIDIINSSTVSVNTTGHENTNMTVVYFCWVESYKKWIWQSFWKKNYSEVNIFNESMFYWHLKLT